MAGAAGASSRFWSLNIGLAWMVFATLLPLGVLQLYHSVDDGYFEARSLGYITNPGNALLEWMRLPGDLLFIVGGCLPFLWIASQGLRHFRSGPTTMELPAGRALHREASPSTGRVSPMEARHLMSINVLLVCGYTLFLVLTAYGFDHHGQARPRCGRNGGGPGPFATTRTTTPGCARRTSGCGRRRSTRSSASSATGPSPRSATPARSRTPARRRATGGR